MLTRAGQGLLGGATILLGIGWALAYPTLVLLGITGLGAIAVAFVWVGVKPQLEVSRYVRPQRVPRDDPAMGVLTVVNTGRRSIAPLLARDRVGTRRLDVLLPRLAPGSEKETTYRIPTDRRGVHQVGPLELTRTDPFGLVRWTRRYGSTDAVWVYPRAHPISAVPSGHRRSLDGPAADTAPHGSITFNTLREYAIGDDLRHVHWRSSAHAGTLMVKQHVDVSLPHTTVVLETRGDLYDDDNFEEAVDIVASLVLAAAGSAYPIRVLTTSGLRVLGQARTDLARIFDHLTAIETDARGHLVDAVESLIHDRVGDTFILVTGHIHPSDLGVLTPLRRRFDRMVAVSLRRPDDPGIASARGITVLSVSSAPEFARASGRGTR